MAALDFPSSPTNGQTYTLNGVYYTYDSTIGAWVTTLLTKPFDTSSSTQILFNDVGVTNGSYGMTFNKTSNTVSFNNVSASYYTGNGSLLTGITTDSAAANNWANTKLANTSDVYFNGNLYYPSGNIGVGRTTSGYAVDVVGTVNASALLVNGSPLSGGASVGDESSSSSTFYPVITTTTSGTMSVANVTTTKLYFVPSTGTLSATIFNSLSDKSLKDNISEFDGLTLLNGIEPVTFTWKDNGNRSYGVIAQDLEQKLPELVQTSDDGLKSVSYIPMIAMLIDVVKKQEKRIAKLEMLLNKENR